jgi:hypothetical protein
VKRPTTALSAPAGAPGRSRALTEDLDLVLDLLDRQVVDPAKHPVCNVDDVEFFEPKNGAPYAVAILVGPAAFAPRFHGLLATWFLAVQRRLHPDRDPEPPRIDFGKVTKVDNAVHVDTPVDGLGVTTFEDWCRENVIAKIPGAGHAGE